MKIVKKMFRLLIRVIVAIIQIPLTIAYFVIGEGSEKSRIEECIRKNHLEDKVIMTGRISDKGI